MIIAAHPDDEVLGCGGTIAQHARRGDEIKIIIVAEGDDRTNIAPCLLGKVLNGSPD